MEFLLIVLSVASLGGWYFWLQFQTAAKQLDTKIELARIQAFSDIDMDELDTPSLKQLPESSESEMNKIRRTSPAKPRRTRVVR